ncbi:hypothetical protein AVEN_208613-1 [Araneus ventricosus]|uniref:HAT C-terminal dimerisation domain-containing protein n=1 Tax=Araneus ventricosus TaxID=182803 RepID=A0A4Y2TVC7_ARAVE|nr:hypothetical protein AVEN_208613-1 [Araneus ventricosus]
MCDRKNAIENQFIETEADQEAGGERHSRYQSIRTSSVCRSSPEFAFVAVFSFEFSLGFAIFAPKFQEYEKKFPTQILDQTTDAYSMLQKDRLKTELGVIYRRSDFRNMTGAISLLQFIIENNLQTTFSETYKLLLIIVTIPMTTAEAERCFSTLKRVKTFLRSTLSEDRLRALAMLSIEKRMINDIPKFNENVINLFALKKSDELI